MQTINVVIIAVLGALVLIGLLELWLAQRAARASQGGEARLVGLMDAMTRLSDAQAASLGPPGHGDSAQP